MNVQNRDLYCFRWSILSCLYPAKDNPHRVSNYTKYENTLNFEGINFPVQVKDIPKFEKQNPNISVNVISLDPDKSGFCIEYLSPERQRCHHINLLLLTDTDTAHYVWIKHFSRLLGERSHRPSFVCNSCLNVFSSQRVLDEHVPYCLQHPAQQTSYPSPDDCKLTFKDQNKQHPLKFYLVCDFESFLVPATSRLDTDAKTHIVDEHSVSGFCCYRVTDLPQYQTLPTVYSGPDVMSHFYEHVMAETKIFDDILSEQIPMSGMTDVDRRRHRAATTCFNCNHPFTHENYKVRHHCHVTGQYLFPCCNNCNLQLKPLAEDGRCFNIW